MQVLSRDGLTEVGKISRQWPGIIREAFTDAGHYGVNFPINLDVKMKAVMLGACFLIVNFHQINFHFTLTRTKWFHSELDRITCTTKVFIKRNFNVTCAEILSYTGNRL